MAAPKDWAEQLQEEDLQTLSAVRLMLSSALRSGSQPELERAAERSIDHLQAEIARLRRLAAQMRRAEQLNSTVV